jgi:hypothetical protein
MHAHIVAISALQTAEDDRRYDGQYPESDESFMDSLNHLGRFGVCAECVLIDICCVVLANALLVSFSAMSA